MNTVNRISSNQTLGASKSSPKIDSKPKGVSGLKDMAMSLRDGVSNRSDRESVSLLNQVNSPETEAAAGQERIAQIMTSLQGPATRLALGIIDKATTEKPEEISLAA